MKDFIEAYYGKTNWWQVLNRYNVNIVLVPSDAPIANLLSLSFKEWLLVYRDKVAVIFLRRALSAFQQSQPMKRQKVT